MNTLICLTTQKCHEVLSRFSNSLFLLKFGCTKLVQVQYNHLNVLNNGLK